jgi:hypothetical protein
MPKNDPVEIPAACRCFGPTRLLRAGVALIHCPRCGGLRPEDRCALCGAALCRSTDLPHRLARYGELAPWGSAAANARAKLDDAIAAILPGPSTPGVTAAYLYVRSRLGSRGCDMAEFGRLLRAMAADGRILARVDPVSGKRYYRRRPPDEPGPTAPGIAE